jgi:hypothetical protein
MGAAVYRAKWRAYELREEKYTKETYKSLGN